MGQQWVKYFYKWIWLCTRVYAACCLQRFINLSCLTLCFKFHQHFFNCRLLLSIVFALEQYSLLISAPPDSNNIGSFFFDHMFFLFHKLQQNSSLKSSPRGGNFIFSYSILLLCNLISKIPNLKLHTLDSTHVLEWMQPWTLNSQTFLRKR